jgi:hypothetical protein
MSHHARQTARKQDIESGVMRFAQAAEMTFQGWTKGTEQNV